MRNEFYIARRLSSRRDGNKAGVMERVATIATAVSLAVVIVTLSVVVGFKEELNAKISGSVSDVVITAPESRGVVSGKAIERCDAIESLLDDERVERYSVYRSKEGVLKSEENIVGVLLKGVDSLYDSSFYEERMLEGAFPNLSAEPRKKEILLSERVAQKMDISVGDRVEMVFIDERSGVLRDRFTLSGIYHTGVDFLDNSYAITDMRNVARLYGGDMLTGYDIWLDEGIDAEVFAEDMDNALLELYFTHGVLAEAFSMQRLFPHIFGWLATHDVTALAVVVIMLIVALLNITTSLLIIVMERQRMIGVLRALGMHRGAVIRIFLYRALFILGRGMVWGIAIALTMIFVQHTWAIIPLPTEGYLLDAVPAALCWGWWILAIAGIVIATVVFMLIPATFSTRISPSVIMRYE